MREVFLNALPFVNRGEQEQRAYLGARAEGLGKAQNKPEMAQRLLQEYDTGSHKNAQGGAVDWLLEQGFNLPSPQRQQPQVLGESIVDDYIPLAPQETVEEFVPQTFPVSGVLREVYPDMTWSTAPMVEEGFPSHFGMK